MAVESKHICNRSLTGSEIEQAGSASKHCLSAVSRRISERPARGKVVSVRKEVLPLVAHSKAHGQIGTNPNIVLDKQTDLRLPKGQVAVSLPLVKGEGPAEVVVFEGREIKGAIKVASVIGFMPGEIGNVNAALDEGAGLIERRTELALSVTERQLYLQIGPRTLSSIVVEHRIK